MLALGADGGSHARREVELVVGLVAALLDVDGCRLADPVVEPAESLSQDRAVGLDRHALALLESVARVVALQERLLDLGVRVQDEWRDLLMSGWGVELLSQEGARAHGACQVELPDLRIRVPSRRSEPLAGGTEEQA